MLSAVVGILLVVQQLLGPSADIPCTKYHMWDAVMVEGTQTSGADKATMRQMWTYVTVMGKPCGAGMRYTITEMCGWAPGDDAVYFDPNRQWVTGTFPTFIPVEVGVKTSCMPDKLKIVYLPLVQGSRW